MKTAIKLILGLLICSIIYAQNITNTLGNNGVFKIKDGITEYFTLNQSTGSIDLISPLAGNQRGSIFKGGAKFIHTYYGSGTIGQNLFLGINSGNFTLGGAAVYNGSFNTGFGYITLSSLTTGFNNSAFGLNSMKNNTDGHDNSSFGSGTLENNTSGNFNSAFGSYTLSRNQSGIFNSGFGYNALWNNNYGNNNSAFGTYGLFSNNSGENNSAFGLNALYSNYYGNSNSSFGVNSLYSNDGNYNSAFGYNSSYSNVNGYQNSAFGSNSLYLNTDGWHNTAVGYDALRNNIIGWQNTAVGHHSLINNTGSYNTAIGYNSGSTVTTGSNLTLIGIDANPSSPASVDQITLGNQYVSTLRCNVTTITSLSDMRDKKNIKDLSLGLDFISKLKPRQFNWDRREWYENGVSDGSKMKTESTAGFIAQELDSLQTMAGAEWLNLVLKDNPEKWEATPGNLLPVIVKSIQELNEKNEMLSAENSELKERLAKLEQIQNVIMIEIEKNSKGNSVENIVKTDN